MSLFKYMPILWQLLKMDLVIFKRTIKDKVINLFIWVFINVFVFGYLLPSFGLIESYSSFMIAGLAAAAGLFEVYPSVLKLVHDFEGDNITSYYATLPMPTYLVFIRQFIFYSFNAAAVSLLVLPVCKLVFWHKFDVSQFSFIKFGIIYILTNLFYGAFTLWLVSRTSNAEKIGNVWIRYVFPLWFLGGFQFSWYVLHKVVPMAAYINLLNPIVYVNEGSRAAIVGQEGYLSVWLCCGMLIIFIILGLTYSIKTLKKRLDLI